MATLLLWISTILCWLHFLVCAGQTLSFHSQSTFTLDNSNISINASRESYEERQCQNILTNYAYDQNLCGASGVESFLKEKKEQFTCTNRCNHAVTYGNTRDCACDDLCVVHNDCCRDMRQVCRDVYTRGMEIFSHLIGAVSMCVETSFAYITNRRAEFSSSVIPFSTATMATTTADTLAGNDEKKTLPFKDRGLKGYFGAFDSFKVADLTYLLIFDNYASFLSWRALSSRPYFIPKLTELDCSGAQETVWGYSSASDILPWCRITSIRGIKTFLHRSCPQLQLIGCRCGNGQGIWNHLYDSCRGQSNSLGLFKRHTELSKMLPFYIAETLPTNIDECTFQKDEFHQGNRGRYLYDNVVEVSSIKMVLTPIFGSVIRETQSAMTDTDNKRKRERGYVEEVTLVSDHSERQSLEYVVELTNTIEKRLQCPRFNSFLSDCVLEDCAKGALLSISPLPDKQFGGRSCILPVLAKSQMPVCTCLRLMSALNDLHVWGLKFNHRNHDECFFQLHIRSEVTAGFPDLYNFYGPNETFEGLLPSYNLRQRVELTLQALQNETAAKAYCPEDNIHQLQVCFYSAEALGQDSVHKAVCLSISQSPGDQSNNRGSPRLSWVSIISLEITYRLLFLFI
ncbi:hypothetical protein PoB_002594600 [Plakobranchus ocellatus]|uniref:SMB domain-containing protein n=1 Tax=Plakobranchus ocellatus TaxID=259542 RepID=A0AAV3ZK16_9GAST|nr:hypothetical protein PoB_002594600 [Plakobranchus ocellatus]